MENFKLCIYVEGELSIIDLVNNETGLTSIYKKSIEDVRKEYPHAMIVPFLHAIERINEHKKDKYPMLQPKEITEEEFYNMFECLPPMDYVSDNDGMSFKMEEMTFGDITSGYVAKAGKYYQMNVKAHTPHKTMMAVVKGI